ncbi:MAG: hypothetical protein CVU11_07585 [Bacteroidetes bacterium HGW-Bacteroidetes-6]|jgi:phage shock protein PspC (stress-responsive transcriptional regulator)|nr:MAG: hypothetical protein CVU11_07585 [Bacteroidetes bacterium HGW-Bacteroidetes-6]
MKKNFSVNIGYRLFNIDEDAYERLQQYLERVRQRLSADETDEVVRDIEIRVAELLSERVSASKEVVVIADIDFVISELGEPEQIEDFSDSDTDKQEETRHERRLYRDADNRILGGVCSGLSEFFDIDSLWVRIAFVVLFMIGGSGLLIYLILWLVVPPAITNADKLRMRGKKVNVNNLSDRIKNEFDHVRNSFRKGKPGKRKASTNPVVSSASTAKSIVESDIFRWIIYIGSVVIGIFMIVFAITFLIGFSLALFSDFTFWGQIHVSGATLSPMDLLFVIATSTILGWIGLISLVGVIAIPLISMIVLGLRLIFRFRFPSRWYNRIVATIWGVSLGALTTVIIYHAIYYSKATYETTTVSVPISEAVVQFSMSQNDPCFPVSENKNKHLMFFGQENGETTLCLRPEIEFKPERVDSVIRVVMHIQNSGKPSEMPIKTCQPTVVDSGHVIIPGYTLFQKGCIQHVDIEIFVPVGKTIFISDEMRILLVDYNEIDERYERHNHFVMTEEGLIPSIELP